VAQYKDFKKSQESRPLLTTALQTDTFSYWDTVPSLIDTYYVYISIQKFWIAGLALDQIEY